MSGVAGTKRGKSRDRLVNCVICGKEFTTNHSRGKYCSDSCQRQGWRRSWREYGGRNRDSRRHYQTGYYEKNKDVVINRVNAYRQTEAGKRAKQISTARMRAKYPEKVKARTMVGAAIKAGTLIPQPCEFCGCEKTQAHHDDYGKPLEVKWVCDSCHKLLHKRIFIEDGSVKK